jgi:hypothetical protein
MVASKSKAAKTIPICKRQIKIIQNERTCGLVKQHHNLEEIFHRELTLTNRLTACSHSSSTGLWLRSCCRRNEDGGFIFSLFSLSCTSFGPTLDINRPVRSKAWGHSRNLPPESPKEVDSAAGRAAIIFGRTMVNLVIGSQS